MLKTENEAPTLAHFCATVSEQNAAARQLAIDAQIKLERIFELSPVIAEAGDATGVERRSVVCAEVIFETAQTVRDMIESIEQACSKIAAALHQEATHA